MVFVVRKFECILDVFKIVLKFIFIFGAIIVTSLVTLLILILIDLVDPI